MKFNNRMIKELGPKFETINQTADEPIVKSEYDIFNDDILAIINIKKELEEERRIPKEEVAEAWSRLFYIYEKENVKNGVIPKEEVAEAWNRLFYLYNKKNVENRVIQKEEVMDSWSRLLYLYKKGIVEWRKHETINGLKTEIGYYIKPGVFVMHYNYGPACIIERNIGKDNYNFQEIFYLEGIEVSRSDVMISSKSDENIVRFHNYNKWSFNEK